MAPWVPRELCHSPRQTRQQKSGVAAPASALRRQVIYCSRRNDRLECRVHPSVSQSTPIPDTPGLPPTDRVRRAARQPALIAAAGPAPLLSPLRRATGRRKFSPTARALYVVITRFQWADGVVPVKRRRPSGINDGLGMSFSAGPGDRRRPAGS